MTNIIPPHKRHQNVPASYVILKKGNKIILQRRCNTGFQDGNYGLISGHVEENESFTKALIREAKEEAGITLAPKDLEVAHVLHRKSYDSERVDVFFLAQSWQGELKNMEPHKCDDLSWFDLNEIPENTVDYICFVLEQIKNKVFYSEYGWE
ncbi:NUDIX domain-containing protein [Patescibacteria group bacterium]|nr:NUDIX domain-containing protein [Patescibacteria group bacterium]